MLTTEFACFSQEFIKLLIMLLIIFSNILSVLLFFILILIDIVKVINHELGVHYEIRLFACPLRSLLSLLPDLSNELLFFLVSLIPCQSFLDSLLLLQINWSHQILINIFVNIILSWFFLVAVTGSWIDLSSEYLIDAHASDHHDCVAKHSILLSHY